MDLNDQNDSEDPTLISGPAAAQMLGISYGTFLRWCANPTMDLPRGYVLGPRSRRWKRSEIAAYISARDRY